MSRDELLARLMTLECERDAYVREINELRRLNGSARIPVTPAVLEALRGGKQTSRDISKHTGLHRKSVQTMLSELAKLGVVKSVPTSGRGRVGHPEHHYRLAA